MASYVWSEREECGQHEHLHVEGLTKNLSIQISEIIRSENFIFTNSRFVTFVKKDNDNIIMEHAEERKTKTKTQN